MRPLKLRYRQLPPAACLRKLQQRIKVAHWAPLTPREWDRGRGLSYVPTNTTSRRGASSAARSRGGLRTPVKEASQAASRHGDATARSRDP